MKNECVITVTFYADDGSDQLKRLDKRYLITNWRDETDLRASLDEIALEMNHISGYGIYSIKAVSNELNFLVNYQETFIPYNDESLNHHIYFDDSLRFLAGYRYGKTKVWLEMPRQRILTGVREPLQLYQTGDKLLKIKIVAPLTTKEAKRKRTKYVIRFDYLNPILHSFTERLALGCLSPITRYPLEQLPIKIQDSMHQIKSLLSWWKLPAAQTTFARLKKKRKLDEKVAKAESRKQQQQKKAGIIFADQEKKKRVDQVYLIEMAANDLSERLYKIGVSNAPGKRLRSLKTSNPFELKIIHTFVATPALDAESFLHEKYKEYRMQGEWFRLPPSVVDEIVQIKKYGNGVFDDKAS